MNKNRIKQFLHEQDLEYEGVGGDASPGGPDYTLGTITEEELNERGVFESSLLKQVTEDGVAFYKSLKRKKS